MSLNEAYLHGKPYACPRKLCRRNIYEVVCGGSGEFHDDQSSNRMDVLYECP